MSVLDRAFVDEVGAVVGERLGLAVDAARLREATEERLRRSGSRDVTLYLERLHDPGGDELGALAELLTVGETYFFRVAAHFDVLRDVVVPDRVRARKERRSLSFLSAGCSTGEEAYSIAMVLEDAVGPEWRVSVEACDVSDRFEEARRRGTFSDWSLRETTELLRDRWFRPGPGGWALDPRILAAVTFRRGNLIDPDGPCWRRDDLDAIFCRNVLMYLEPHAARFLVDRLAAALAPGGYLFLGHAESLRGMSQAFELRHTEGAFYYQLRAGAPRTVGPHGRIPLPREGVEPVAVDPRGSWVQTIAEASDRVERLRRSLPPVEIAGPSLDRVTDLLRAERFDEALEVLGALPERVRRDVDTQLLVAVALTHRGLVDEAEEVCRQILDVDGLHAGAHYLLGLCREHRGDADAAIDADRAAIHLDPTFAMPRLHLGLLHGRRGEREAARRELEKALALLPLEDSSRILLFGGGFDRSALVRLVEVRLDALGKVR